MTSTLEIFFFGGFPVGIIMYEQEGKKGGDVLEERRDW